MFLDSFNRFFFRLFPIPKFLVTSSFGLDISDESLKFVELIATNNGIKLGKYGERKIPIGIIEAGKIKDSKGLENVLTTLRKEEGIKFVRVSLPEEQVYLFKLNLDKAGLINVREGIELSLEEHIPIQAQEAIFDYETLKEDDQKLALQIGAIPQNIIENYLLVFRNSLISVQSFELEAQAISRSVIKKGDKGTYMIVDFGRTRAGIFIISEGVAVFTSTLNLGGDMLTGMIKKNFNVTTEEAEQMKKKFGLQRNSDNREIFSVLLNSVSVLRDEMMKNLLYWQTHKDEYGKDHPPVEKILLTGGDANLIGLAEYFSISTKNKVEVGNVWTNITDTGNSTPEITFNKSLTFAAALGLALGDFEYD
ncbi:MAG: pilus assembly protein PilM [Candidatus Paceibacterota bacterium]